MNLYISISKLLKCKIFNMDTFNCIILCLMVQGFNIPKSE